MKFYFLDIDTSYILEGKQFSFPIFKLSSDTNNRELIINKNETIESIHIEKLDINNSTSKIQIYYNSSKAYLEETQTNFKELVVINKAKFDFLLLAQTRKKLLTSNPLVKMLELCVDTKINNYKFLKKIRIATLEDVTSFNIENSEFINATICLCEKVFTRDFKRVQVASVAYQIAKKLKVTNPITLSKIIMVSLLKNIGELNSTQAQSASYLLPNSNHLKETLECSISILNAHSSDIYLEVIELLKYFITLETDTEREELKQIYEIVWAAELICISLENESLIDLDMDAIFTNEYEQYFNEYQVIKDVAKKVINL